MEGRKSIKTWHEDDKPREKLERNGRSALSLSELLGILIATGVRLKDAQGRIYSKSAVDLGKDILALGQGDIDKVARLSLAELQTIDGIGPAKAITIAAALELGLRRNMAETNREIKKISTSRDAYEILRLHMQDLTVEQFWVLFLNRNNMVIRPELHTQGGLTSTIIDTSQLYKKAILCNASNIVVAHNHPSGSLQPSLSDIQITTKLLRAGKLLNINVIDHLIITATSYYSFADNGKMPIDDGGAQV